MAKPKKPRTTRVKASLTKPKPSTATGLKLYEMDVALVTGPITKAYARKNPYVTRTIQIRGDQTLADLHDAIFDAYDRFDAHMYEFQIGGKRPMDPKARRYVLPVGMQDDGTEPRPSGVVHDTRIDAAGLRTGSAFGYWFDFGDDWWHQITVLAIHDEIPAGKYPKITARTGASPPQYPDLDEEGDEDDEDDEDDDEEDEEQ